MATCCTINKSLFVRPRPSAEGTYGGKMKYVYTQGLVKMGEA